ncbi:MAG: permease prefix domain 1-containing protein [Anaerolineae bacterium]|jgi:predicted RNase H-like HicB family nuclease
MTGMDDLLGCISAQMDLDGETEQEVLAEIRDHLEEAVAEAQARGLDEAEALAQAAARFGLEEEVGRELQAAHAGWGTADAVVAAALPVLGALVLRWLAFAPDGTALGWPQLLSRPAFWIVALVSLLVPLLKFERWRYALATWVLFWTLTVIFIALPALRW